MEVFSSDLRSRGSAPNEDRLLCSTLDHHPFLIFLLTQWVSERRKSSYDTSQGLFVFRILGKPRGLRTARKLKDHRREQRWHDKDYKKSHLGTRWKSNPFAGASHAKGIVLEKVCVVLERGERRH